MAKSSTTQKPVAGTSGRVSLAKALQEITKTRPAPVPSASNYTGPIRGNPLFSGLAGPAASVR